MRSSFACMFLQACKGGLTYSSGLSYQLWELCWCLCKTMLRFGLLPFPVKSFFEGGLPPRLRTGWQSYVRAVGQRLPAPLLQCTYSPQPLSTAAHQKQFPELARTRAEKRNR